MSLPADTIAAISTPPGPGAIGILRLSGPLAVEVARKEGAVKPGDTVVITAGVPIGISGTTNLIKAQVVGERL